MPWLNSGKEQHLCARTLLLKNLPDLQPVSAGARLSSGVTLSDATTPVTMEEMPHSWQLSPRKRGRPSPALALSLPRRGRKPESTFW